MLQRSQRLVCIDTVALMSDRPLEARWVHRQTMVEQLISTMEMSDILSLDRTTMITGGERDRQDELFPEASVTA